MWLDGIRFKLVSTCCSPLQQGLEGFEENSMARVMSHRLSLLSVEFHMLLQCNCEEILLAAGRRLPLCQCHLYQCRSCKQGQKPRRLTVPQPLIAVRSLKLTIWASTAEPAQQHNSVPDVDGRMKPCCRGNSVHNCCESTTGVSQQLCRTNCR